MAVTGAAVHQDRIGPRELACFRRIHELPGWLYRPLWPVMQLGNVAAGPLTGAVAVAAGRPGLARRLVLDGLTTWSLAKVFKRIYRRPRPLALVTGARSRGPEASGLGYVSGHAAIAVALATAAYPELSRAGRAATVLAVSTVGAARIYVGAHLPLDVVGGAALGLSVDALVSRVR